MKKLFIICSMLSLSALHSQKMETKSKNKKESIAVSGNCEMCKARIEKASLKTKGVKYAFWNVASKQLNLIYNEQKVSLEEIEQSILSAGHDSGSLKTSESAYKKLHVCCQYRE